MAQVAKFFVGGLAAETTEDDLRNHFEQFGELVDVAAMKDQYGVPRCFGFVQYADANAHNCRPTDEHIILDKKVDVKAAVPKEAIDQGAPIRTNKIFVGGLSKASSAETVQGHFSRFGTVTEVLMKFNEIGESRGFCFVEFDSEDVAEEACQTKGQMVDDKEVECKLARPLGDRSLTSARGFGKGKGGFGKGGYGKGEYDGYGKGKGGPMRTDFFGGKGGRSSPYAPASRGFGKGYDTGYGAPAYAPPAPGGYARGGYGKGAYGGGKGAPAPVYAGKGADAYAPAPTYAAPASPYGGYSNQGYSAAPAYAPPAPAYSTAAPAYGGYSSYAPPAPPAAAPSYGGYAGYGQGY